MKAATERLLIRWLHLLASIPILGFIYGPVADIPRAARAVRWVIMPVVIVSGLWLWKGHLLRQWWRARSAGDAASVPPARPARRWPPLSPKR